MRTLVLAALVASLVAAGCVSAPQDLDAASVGGVPSADAATWDAVRTLVGDLPCEAGEVGAETSENIMPLGASLGESAHYGEMDVRGDVAIVGGGQAFDIIDLSDPRSPTLLASLPLEVSTADVKWLPGVDGAVIGAYEGKLVFVDLADLTAPVIAGEADVATQAHMVQPAVVDNVTYIYVASQSANQPAFVYEVDGWSAELVGSFGFPVIGGGPGLGNHDIAIVEDEILGETILYLADGLAGWSAWSLADPAAPERIGQSLGQELGVGYVHTVRVGFFEGKRIVVTMMEVGQNTLKVYDATDLSMPVLLARWNADATRPNIPQHNIQLLGEWLFMGHYTEGVYVFNLSEVIAGPPLLGTLSLAPMAHYAVESPQDGGALGFANIWDVAVVRGVIWRTDSSTGAFESAAFGCLPLGDAAASATL